VPRLNRIAIAALVLIAIACTSFPAGATVFVAPSDAELTAASDVIVTGSVTAIRSVADEDGAMINTYVTLDVSEVVKGRLRRREITIREVGGEVDGMRMWLEGTPEFTVGETVLLFLQRRPDGTLGTTNLTLGKYSVSGESVAVAGRSTTEPVIGGPQHDVRSLKAMLSTVRALAAASPAAFVDAVEDPSAAHDDSLPHSVVSGFSFLGPGRWNEADDGMTIEYLVDDGGEPALGLTETVDAVEQAMTAWNDVTTASIDLAVGGTAAARIMACDGISQIVFNDPFGDVPNPSGCSGILALGGFCGTSSVKTTVNGVQFIKITEANITMNNGFSGCGFWTKANIAEVLTHEIGHTIGLGHSSERAGESNNTLFDATMYYRAHFDGRGASIRQDDTDAVSFVYPDCDPADADCDGVLDPDDNCPAVENAGQIDTDADTVGDMCDNCPTLSNPTQEAPAGCMAVTVRELTVKQNKGARDRLTLRGTFVMPVDEVLDAADGLSFLLADGTGNLLSQDVTIRASRTTKRQVRFRGRSTDRSLKIRVRSRDGERYRVTVSGKRLALRTGDAPILTSVSMGSHAVSTKLATCQSRRKGKRLVCN
jgi:hypothetical protein